MTEQLVTCEYDGGVATLLLRRPPRNILNIEMMEQMNQLLLDFRDHPELKVLLIRGVGEWFCGGVDVADRTRDKVARMLQVFHRIFETMRLLDVISIAAVDGNAAGGGFELAIGCNLILSSTSAKYSLPQVSMGSIPPMASVVLPRVTPRRKAMDWILTGDEISAAELERYGLVSRLFPDDGFDEGVANYLEKIVRQSGPVLQLAKRAQVESYYATYEEALFKVENLYLRELLSLADSQEGIQAHLEGRPPQWRDA